MSQILPSPSPPASSKSLSNLFKASVHGVVSINQTWADSGFLPSTVGAGMHWACVTRSRGGCYMCLDMISLAAALHEECLEFAMPSTLLGCYGLEHSIYPRRWTLYEFSRAKRLLFLSHEDKRSELFTGVAHARFDVVALQMQPCRAIDLMRVELLRTRVFTAAGFCISSFGNLEPLTGPGSRKESLAHEVLGVCAGVALKLR
ncbi:hypothetical protein BDZ45DRAFT_736477 [Acephala macrosclerotiorum]|nr:hypothetical protein BDZ45DRAFT_736477 [Acephala macrosclerotiorum]